MKKTYTYIYIKKINLTPSSEIVEELTKEMIIIWRFQVHKVGRSSLPEVVHLLLRFLCRLGCGSLLFLKIHTGTLIFIPNKTKLGLFQVRAVPGKKESGSFLPPNQHNLNVSKTHHHLILLQFNPHQQN